MIVGNDLGSIDNNKLFVIINSMGGLFVVFNTINNYLFRHQPIIDNNKFH